MNIVPASSAHGHSAEEGLEEVVVLFELIVFLIRLSVLRTRTIFLWPKAVIVRFLISIDQRGVGIRDFLEDFFGACMEGRVPSNWFLSG